MQLSWEGKLETGCLQVTFRSLWLLRKRRRIKELIAEHVAHTGYISTIHLRPIKHVYINIFLSCCSCKEFLRQLSLYWLGRHTIWKKLKNQNVKLCRHSWCLWEKNCANVKWNRGVCWNHHLQIMYSIYRLHQSAVRPTLRLMTEVIQMPASHPAVQLQRPMVISTLTWLARHRPRNLWGGGAEGLSQLSSKVAPGQSSVWCGWFGLDSVD